MIVQLVDFDKLRLDTQVPDGRVALRLDLTPLVERMQLGIVSLLENFKECSWSSLQILRSSPTSGCLPPRPSNRKLLIQALLH